ncbi:MAG: hypothetical protein LC803_22745 [Acidobacteria bacterium]|nr:hypothetical protein [Acidobacteriota bacterium]
MPKRGSTAHSATSTQSTTREISQGGWLSHSVLEQPSPSALDRLSQAVEVCALESLQILFDQIEAEDAQLKVLGQLAEEGASSLYSNWSKAETTS